MPGTPALELLRVSKRFSGIVAVDDVSFTARAGEITAYLGPNGSGKSTTMKMITGLIEATAGEILFDGVRVSKDPIAYRARMEADKQGHFSASLTPGFYDVCIMADAFSPSCEKVFVDHSPVALKTQLKADPKVMERLEGKF